MTIDDVLERLPSTKKFKAGVPATDEEIASLETQLGIVLSDSYRKFLRTFGYVKWFGHALFGVYTPPAGERVLFDYDAIRRTVAARAERLPEGFEAFPENAVVIERYDAGGYYVLFSAMGDLGGKVALLDHEQTGSLSQLWPSFEDFVAAHAEL